MAPREAIEPRDRILIAVGDVRLRRLAARILADSEFQVDLAHSAKVALDRASGMSFSLAICDVRLPDRLGLELALELRAAQPHLDGTGYPNGLRGDEIPEAGRIVAVADTFDALINDRVYRKALPLPEAIRIMREGCGTPFDETVLDALFAHLDEVLAVQASADRAPERAARRATPA